VLGQCRQAFGREAHEQDRFVRQSSQGIGALIRVSLAQSFQLSRRADHPLSGQHSFFSWACDMSRRFDLGRTALVNSILRSCTYLKSIGNQVTSMQRSLAVLSEPSPLLEAPDVVEQKQSRSLVPRVV